jgi:hypothetical protein
MGIIDEYIKKLINVYQPKYLNGNAPGFGDYFE